MRGDRTNRLNIFTRTLLVLFAVFYVSIFSIQALHNHDNLTETITLSENPDPCSTSDTGSGTSNCDICAYFAHHGNHKAIVNVTIPTIAPVVLGAIFLNELGLTRTYQTIPRNFVNKGPPCDLA